jgi:cellulose synthase/poly-beta-1,6-N-acetylglucosamine synthase-like glycosyltransferase
VQWQKFKILNITDNNKRSSDMEKQIENILIKVDEGTMPVQQALSELLRLFNVISSVCDCEPHTFYEWEKDENKCSQCGKKIYEQTDL